MDVVVYALLCYGLTAVISFLLIGIAVGINRAAGGGPRNVDRQG